MADRDRDFIGTREYRPNPANGVSGMNRGRLGRKAPGWEANPAAKLTPDQIGTIRRRYLEGWTYEEIAAELPVSDRAVGKIVRRERWAHV